MTAFRKEASRHLGRATNSGRSWESVSNHRSSRASSRQWASCAERAIASLVQGSDLEGEGEEANSSFNSEFITTAHTSQQPVQHSFNKVNMLR